MRCFPSLNRYLAVCGRDLVVLNAEDGDYALLAGAGDGVVIGPDGVLQIEDHDLAVALVENGLVGERPSSSPVGRPPALPVRSAFDQPQQRTGARHLAAMVLAGIETPLIYPGQPFPSLLDRARQGRRGVDPDRCDGALMAAAAAFDLASPWIPLRGECLLRSFVLLRVLLRQGYAPRWVFGVRTWPFAAHCWLQAGEVALTDFADTLQPFTPIMAV